MKDYFSKLEDVPLMLSASQLALFLGISRARAYTLMHTKGFPTVHIGKRMLCPKERVIFWLEQQVATEADDWTVLKGM